MEGKEGEGKEGEGRGVGNVLNVHCNLPNV